MPLPRKIDDDDDAGNAHAHFVWPLAGFAEVAMGFATELVSGFKASTSVEPPDVPRVGKYVADYSELTPEEIGNLDAECTALFKRSKPVSR